MNHREHIVQKELINYVRYKYSVEPIPCNIEGKRNPGQQRRFKELGNYSGILDLFYPMPNKKYHGLFIELKAEGVTVFKKDGTVRASTNDRLQSQWDNIQLYRKRGYAADFAIGLDQAMEQVDIYFQNKYDGL